MALSHIRKRYFIDAKVQGALLARTAWYWGFCLTTVAIMLTVWRILTGPSDGLFDQMFDMWTRFGPAVIATILLLPIVLLDVVRLSNRFAGPAFRLRQSMRALARGENVQPVHFRDGDFWMDFAEDFNAVLARLQDAETRDDAALADEQSEKAAVATS